MKKQKLKSLRLNKKSISNFNSSIIYGGDDRFESVRICPVGDTGTIGGGSATYNNCTVGCDTRLQDTCGCVDPDPTGTSNLASPC